MEKHSDVSPGWLIRGVQKIRFRRELPVISFNENCAFTVAISYRHEGRELGILLKKPAAEVVLSLWFTRRIIQWSIPRHNYKVCGKSLCSPYFLQARTTGKRHRPKHHITSTTERMGWLLWWVNKVWPDLLVLTTTSIIKTLAGESISLYGLIFIRERRLLWISCKHISLEFQTEVTDNGPSIK